MEANNHVNNIIIEYVEGIEVVKAFNQSTSSYEKFVGAVKSFKDFTLNWFKSTWKTMNLMMAIMPTTLLGVLPVGLLLVRGGSITPAELAMGIILSLSIVGPLMKATTFINEAKSMEYAVEAANELLNLPNLPDSGEFVPINHTDIVLQDVSFSYDGTTQNEVLHGISLNMPQGSFTALVGPSGGGKSTVARLIARFWDVTGGSISIGGKNIKELSIHQLSELVSFVTQDNFLFNCSLKENIRLGNPNATDEEVYAAAKAACCDDFIARLEKGYDTPAGDAGKRLSGGEKQRIAIARAILKNAPIVILDEATAFTDPQNEDKIQKSIMALSKGKTLLVIAHRLSTIQNADQIVVLKKGQIVDCGKQGELLERCPLYADMWQAHIGAKKNNIKFGSPDATDEQIIAAAKAARCHDFIMALPDGYDTVIGEGGSSLSGGEKQRISIARAMLKDAPIIILDEATASIDPENEHLIQEAISALTHGKTIITIAHRLATIENADQILVIDGGTVAQRGTHKELLQQEGTYKKFIQIREQAEGWRIQ